MEETLHSHASIGSVALEDTDPAENLAVRLSVVEDDEADLVSSPEQLAAQEDLLTLCSPDMCEVLALGERCVCVWRDEAY